MQRRKTTLLVVIIISAVLALISAGMLINILWSEHMDAEHDKAVSSLFNDQDDDSENPSPQEARTTPKDDDPIAESPLSHKIDFKALSEANSDVVGWIYQTGTPIDYPVLQSSDNKYYLDRSFEKTYSKSGSIFADFRTKVGDNSIILYGHNASRRTLVKFSSLLSYLDGPEYLSTHPSFEFYDANTGEGKIYDVFAVMKANVSTQAHADEYYRYVPDEDFDKYVSFLSDQSIYDTGIIPQSGQKLIILSTCVTGHYNVRCMICLVERLPDEAGTSDPEIASDIMLNSSEVD